MVCDYVGLRTTKMAEAIEVDIDEYATPIMPIRNPVRARSSVRRRSSGPAPIRGWECKVCAATAQPYVLHPCGHSICVRCFERLQETGTPPTKRCPECNKHVQGAAKNYALIDALEGRTNAGSSLNILNSVRESMEWRGKQQRRNILVYCEFLAKLMTTAKNTDSIVISVKYTWQDLENHFKEVEEAIHPLIRFNIHALFIAAIPLLELPDRVQHTCIEPDRYHLEIVTPSSQDNANMYISA